MTDYSHIKLDLKQAETEDLYRHPEDRSVRFDKSSDIFKHINMLFRRNFPWMYIFLTYKSNGKRVLFHCLRSIPIISVRKSYTEENNIILNADWTGDNTDTFFESKKPQKPKKLKNISWEKVKTDKKLKKVENENEFISFDGGPPRKYISQLRMAINDISSVYVYNSGFEVQTDSPIDMACIKRSCIVKYNQNDLPQGFNQLNANSNNSYELEQGIINNILEKEHFVLPSEVIHIKKLRACWNKKTQNEKNERVDSWLLGDYGKTEPEINVGQEANKNIILD